VDLSRFELLTFDCYGTLVDWERGILEALRPLLAAHGLAEDDEALLARYARLETAAEAGPYRRYAEVLAAVVDGLGAELGFEPTPAERASLAASVPSWPPFADTVEALARLRRRYRLAVLSNVDDDLFAGTAERLGVPFDWVVTAEQVGSYKPALGHFLEIERVSALPVARILHVAQSLFHDVAAAQPLGFATVWVNRRGDRPGTGATPVASAVPDLEVPDLATLARLAGF
jgi:2-haloacid dehalogenase